MLQIKASEEQANVSKDCAKLIEAEMKTAPVKSQSCAGTVKGK
jgi:hypothetical protein